MNVCHICLTELTEENKWVDGLCNYCVEKIKTNKYFVIVCEKHSLPQDLYLRKNDKPYPEYFFVSRCKLENELII